MTPAGRRAVLRLAAGFALAPALAVRAAAHEGGGAVFQPPGEPLRYTRRLVRELRGGYRFAVTRSFAVRFAPLPAGGYAVDGEQVSVEVAAPERMAPFSELERRRIETGVFPLRLDRRGIIEHGPGLQRSPVFEEAVAEALRMVAAPPVSPAEQAEAEAFIQRLHQAGVSLAAHLPADLFAPVGHSRTDHQTVEGPGRDMGELEVVFTAEADPHTGLMVRARRDIVTTIEGDRRACEEDWTLSPL